MSAFGGKADIAQEPSFVSGQIDGHQITRHSDLMPANLITFAHFSVSSLTSFPKSAGEPETVMPPRSTSRAWSAGSAKPALISLLSLPMTAFGVFRGALTPYQALAS